MKKTCCILLLFFSTNLYCKDFNLFSLINHCKNESKDAICQGINTTTDYASVYIQKNINESLVFSSSLLINFYTTKGIKFNKIMLNNDFIRINKNKLEYQILFDF